MFRFTTATVLTPVAAGAGTVLVRTVAVLLRAASPHRGTPP